MSAEIYDLGANENMTPTEARAVAARKPWEDVIIIGFTEDSRDVVVVSSRVDRSTANWIVDHAKLHVLDRL